MVDASQSLKSCSADPHNWLMWGMCQSLAELGVWYWLTHFYYRVDAVSELRSGSVAQPHAVSSVYIRWGRKSCPANDTDVVYSGVIGGGRYDETGSTSNYLCLPNQPLWAPETTSQSSYVSHMYGAEYETHTAPQLSKLHNQEAPCVVCRLRGRNTLMIPARNVCFPGWRREYAGFLMSMYYKYKGNKNAICVDAEAEITENSNDSNQDGALMYFVQAKCGSLKCPPYEEKRLLTCVVCSI